MSPSFPLHGCHHAKLRRASLPALVPGVGQQSQGKLCSLTALEWLDRTSQVSSELGGDGCSTQGSLVGTRRNWHCSTFSCFWNCTCASGCQPECSLHSLGLPEQGKLCQDLQAAIFHGFITWAELVKSRRWAVSKLQQKCHPPSTSQVPPSQQGMPVIF